jgi:hypothetical protein
MSCLKYKDYTRECVMKYKGLLEVASFDFCDATIPAVLLILRIFYNYASNVQQSQDQ